MIVVSPPLSGTTCQSFQRTREGRGLGIAATNGVSSFSRFPFISLLRFARRDLKFRESLPSALSGVSRARRKEDTSDRRDFRSSSMSGGGGLISAIAREDKTPDAQVHPPTRESAWVFCRLEIACVSSALEKSQERQSTPKALTSPRRPSAAKYFLGCNGIRP
jgi:hypothetical protein